MQHNKFKLFIFVVCCVFLPVNSPASPVNRNQFSGAAKPALKIDYSAKKKKNERRNWGIHPAVWMSMTSNEVGLQPSINLNKYV